MPFGDRLQDLNLDAGRFIVMGGARERPEPGVGTGEDALHLLHAFHRRNRLQFIGNRGRREIPVTGLIEAVGQGFEYLGFAVADLWPAVLAVDVLGFEFENFARGFLRIRMRGNNNHGRSRQERGGAAKGNSHKVCLCYGA